MIKGIITDIDGVIVGEKVGYNSPFPHTDIISRIKKIHASGVPVTLCTGKPYYAIEKIISDCKLNNPHITDGGAIIIDPITNTIIKKHVIDKSLVQQLVDVCIAQNMYIEIYTPDRYIIQRSQIRDILTPVHTHILQTKPLIVDSLLGESATHEVIKIILIATNPEDAKRLKNIYEPFKDLLSLAMGVHPIALPHQFGLMTGAGVSKKQSAIDATATLGIPLTDYLGVGDSTSDWSFIELCGYAAAVDNATDELKKLVLSRGLNRGFIGPSVDENVILPILDHFSL